MAHRACRIQAMHLADPPPSPCPMELVAAQAGARFSNSPLQASSTRSGARALLLLSTPPPRTASPVSVAKTPMPAAAPCKQQQKPGAWRATCRWPAPPHPPPSSRRSRTREAAAAWVPWMPPRRRCQHTQQVSCRILLLREPSSTPHGLHGRGEC